MFKIKMEDIDELCAVTNEIDVITYLLELVNADNEGVVLYENGKKNRVEGARYYLFEKQNIAVQRLIDVLSKDNLLEHI